MYTPIENMPPTSRVWVYQANRKLTAFDMEAISQNLKLFCDQWAAHGTPLQSSFEVRHDRFVVLSVNEGVAPASGCSIDSSTHVIKQLERQLSLDFFTRVEVAFLENGSLTTFPLGDLKKLFADGRLNENSITFNTLVSTLGEWRNQSQLRVANSWLKRYLQKVAASSMD
jgi:hypothetical protein